MPAPEGYIDVASRIAEFRAKHPDGTLRLADTSQPFQIVKIEDKTFVVVVAAAYRNQDDQAPGIGTAWEPVPGLTNFTRNSELQNAETSAWGRAIIAVGAADSKQGVASSEDVRNRQAEQDAAVPGVTVQDAKRALLAACDGNADMAANIFRGSPLAAEASWKVISPAQAQALVDLAPATTDPGSAPPDAQDAPDGPDGTEGAADPPAATQGVRVAPPVKDRLGEIIAEVTAMSGQEVTDALTALGLAADDAMGKRRQRLAAHQAAAEGLS